MLMKTNDDYIWDYGNDDYSTMDTVYFTYDMHGCLNEVAQLINGNATAYVVITNDVNVIDL